jgi:hypothetical protein
MVLFITTTTRTSKPTQVRIFYIILSYCWRALVNMVMNLHIPQNDEKFLSSCRIGGFSRRAQLHEVS